MRNITVSYLAGQWFAAVQWQLEVPDPEQSSLPTVAIDMGLAAFATLSNGSQVAPTNQGKKALRSLRRAQRKISRRKRGSNNRSKAIKRVQKLNARAANARKDFLHKQSTIIAKNHGTVVVEALKVRSMTASARGTVEKPGRNVRQKAGLNRSILDQGWGMFRSMLRYKLADRGGKLIEVPAAYTSQTCSECGVIDPRSRVSQERFVCTGCGHAMNADHNAALNILHRGRDTALLPVEDTALSGPVNQEAPQERHNADLGNARSLASACQMVWTNRTKTLSVEV